MAFNTTKCNVLRITRRQTPIIFDYYDRALEAVNITKYLGIHLSEDLRWNEHVRNISNKANKTLGFLKRNLRHCSAATKDRAYKVLVYNQQLNTALLYGTHTQPRTSDRWRWFRE